MSDIVTRSSGRLDAGKNCCCTKPKPKTEAPKGDQRDSDGEPTMPHAQFEHPPEGAHEAAGLSGVRLHARRQNCEPDHRREDDGDEPRCNECQGDNGEQREVYCPVLLAAKPIGRNPKIVISVPVSMGNAVEV